MPSAVLARSGNVASVKTIGDSLQCDGSLCLPEGFFDLAYDWCDVGRPLIGALLVESSGGYFLDGYRRLGADLTSQIKLRHGRPVLKAYRKRGTYGECKMEEAAMRKIATPTIIR
jgi:hypothetical protein